MFINAPAELKKNQMFSIPVLQKAKSYFYKKVLRLFDIQIHLIYAYITLGSSQAF